jgi:glycosyltransferase involved in cell wall biosynthesis
MTRQSKISIVLPTYNGEGKIPVLLRALKVQTIHNFEVIVMIDGSTDCTHKLVETFEAPFPILIFDQPNQGRGIVRNSGAAKASGDLLIFFDDDMEPSADAVQRHLQFHQNHFGLVCGNPIEVEGTSQGDIQNYKAGLAKKWTDKYLPGLNRMNFENLFFTAGTFSVHKDIFNALGGFDNRLSDAEDYDLAYRALEKNIPVYFDKGNLSIHHDKITCLSYIRRIRQYSAAHLKLASLHPNRIPLRTTGQSSVRKLFYFLFSFSFWIQLVDRERLKFLPKSWRYKIYEWIIFSFGFVFRESQI